MSPKKTSTDLFTSVVSKSCLKQEVYAKTLEIFNQFKQETQNLVKKYHQKIRETPYSIPFAFKDHGQFAYQLAFGSDILVFFMHTNVFEFPRDHEVMKSPYIKQDKTRSYCGIIHIFNFLGDSFRYNRISDVGYLIGRIFVNRELHYFVEGKKEVGLLYNNFPTSVLDKEAIRSILDSSILYTIHFDLLTPPFDDMKEVTVQDMKTVLETMQFRTGKRLGFRFQADKVED
ncbi:MAG TPA: hypothetical protein VMC08_08885 [Bacteroidales bacterium]|nr:hypothetical protein [Bacteroidales bacterium]